MREPSVRRFSLFYILYEMKMVKTERNSNLELYRIIVMLLIVAHHYVVHGGLLSIAANDPLSVRSVFFHIIGAWGKTGINCFVLITGYFMCTKSITLRKFAKLILTVVFYNVVIYFALVLAGVTQFDIRGCYDSIMPILWIGGGFVECYLVFYLFIPFLNILVRNATRRQLAMLIVLCLCIYSFYRFVPRSRVIYNEVMWYSVLYFISSFLRLYPPKLKKPFTVYATGGGICLLLALLVMLYSLKSGVGIENMSAWRGVQGSSTPLALLLALSLFLIFKDLRVPQSRVINRIAATTFGVLLIHDNNWDMRRFLWHDIFANAAHYGDTLFFLRPLVVILLVFAACSAIDAMRLRFVEPLFFSILSRVESRVRPIYRRFLRSKTTGFDMK